MKRARPEDDDARRGSDGSAEEDGSLAKRQLVVAAPAPSEADDIKVPVSIPRNRKMSFGVEGDGGGWAGARCLSGAARNRLAKLPTLASRFPCAA